MPFDIEDMRRKAEAGLTPSQCVLGLFYLYGYEVEKDYAKAFRFLSAAAEKGASRAVLNLGRMYAQGLGIPQNLPEAIRLFERAAKLVDSSDGFAARIELARIFAQGLGVPVDVKLAQKWYAAAVDVATDEDDPEELKEARDSLNR